MKERLKIILVCMVWIFAIGWGCSAIHAQAKVTINKKTAKLNVGSSVNLSVKGTKKRVKWSTSNKKIASVKAVGKVKCKVTAKKAGKVTVTGKVSGKKYKCKVTVYNNTVSNADSKQSDSDKQDDKQDDKPVDADKEDKSNKEADAGKEEASDKAADTDKEEASDKTADTDKDNSTDGNDGTEPSKASESAEPSEDTMGVDAGEYTITAVHTGEGTFYDRTSEGAAKLDSYEDIYYTAAMQTDDYMNGLAGAYIEITDKDGDQIKVMITDRLPEGEKGDIDLSRKAFNVIEPESTGRMDITWKIVPLPTDEPIQYLFKTESTQWWAEVQVRNHRYPIAKLEYLDTSANAYVELPRQEYNYFRAESGMGGGPFTFRVTDIYGHELVDTGIALDTTGTPVNGSANFPY